MCGIIGITGKRPVYTLITDTLRRLEYRGYDSAGLATTSRGKIDLWRAEGKLHNLEALIARSDKPPPGTCGIGHTRWATHGRPTERNAHPHISDNVAVVHNGIIENFRTLKSQLEKQGVRFTSETDSEVIVHTIDYHLQQGDDPLVATQKTLRRLEGAFAIVILFRDHPTMLIGARRGSPLAIGISDDTEEMYLSSDAIALAPFTQKICYLEEGDHAVITPQQFTLYNAHNKKIDRAVTLTATSGAMSGKGEFPHYMLKEIYEQPAVVGETIETYIDPLQRTITMPAIGDIFGQSASCRLVACGTSYYAAQVARILLERYAHTRVHCDYASEFRYRDPVLSAGQPCLFISQSGETADTLAAMRLARQNKNPCIALVNVAESSLAREADHFILTHAGPEIGVASTKAFTTQLAALACLTLVLAHHRNTLPQATIQTLAHALIELPTRINQILKQADAIKDIAHDLAKAHHVMYLGRDTTYPIALEGALKLKEIAYIHAHAHAAGEMKHGPIALIDETMPSIILAPPSDVQVKTLSNMAEIASRGGPIILISDENAIKKSNPQHAFAMPDAHDFTNPILYTIPIQLLAYHTAASLGTDVDQPKNLAKAVTVE